MQCARVAPGALDCRRGGWRVGTMGCKLAWLIAVLLAMPAAFSYAGDAEPEKTKEEKTKEEKTKGEKGEKHAGRMGMWYPPTIENLKKKTDIDEEQAKKLEAARKEISDKLGELAAKDDVKAAQDEVKKAREAKDRDAVKAAEAKLKTAMGGYSASEEWEKKIKEILRPEQIEKLKPHKEPKTEKPEKTEKKTAGGE